MVKCPRFSLELRLSIQEFVSQQRAQADRQSGLEAGSHMKVELGCSSSCQPNTITLWSGSRPKLRVYLYRASAGQSQTSSSMCIPLHDTEKDLCWGWFYVWSQD